MFLKRCIDSILEQTYKDWELIITEDVGASKNTNNAMRKARGDLIKIMHMDDFFAHPKALENIVNNFKGDWLVTGCTHTHGKDRFNDHLARWNDQIHTGNNTIGAPSVLTIRKGVDVWFDENSKWLLDCLFYKELYDKYGEPVILDDINVVIGIHEDQMTNILTDKEKEEEIKRYV